MNRFIKYIIIGTLCLTAGLGVSQERPRRACLEKLEALFEEGRHCYVDIGNKTHVMNVADAYMATVEKGMKEGVLIDDDLARLLFDVKYLKLLGDYHYLNADDDFLSYEKAEDCFKKALAIAESNIRSNDANYYQFVLHEELGQLYYKQYRFQEAYDEMKKAEAYAFYLDNDADLLDFISQLAICKARVALFDEALDDIERVIEYYPDRKSERYGEALRKKAKILMLKQENGGSGMTAPADDALKCYKEYFALKKADALQRLDGMSPENREQYWMRTRPFAVDCYRTEAADPAFLYDVTLFTKSLLLEYSHSGKPRTTTWKQVQSKLKPNECAVEFVQYEKYGEKQMGALVLKKKGEPQFVKIGRLTDIEDMPLASGGYLFDAVVNDAGLLKNNLYSDSAVFQYIWTPELLTAIGKETQRLYFATDGLFHELAIEYMLPKAPELTSLKTENLYRLSSTRQLLAKTDKRSKGKVLLCGGIDFNRASQADGDGEADYVNDGQAYQFLKSAGAGFNYLYGTEVEIEGILNEYDDTQVTLLTDTMATETHAAYQITRHPIVHLATHGFYLGTMSEGTDLLPASYDESLSQSGLAFAGCTTSLVANNFNATQHDGLLSSREIARMDFSGVDLIVLSACQTALGYMTDDGIYGLQRSLKNAGVKAMILSLWSVDDDATSILMQAFYKHLQNEDIHTAFMHAREDLTNSVQEVIEQLNPVTLTTEQTSYYFDLPYYYNAFIMIDVQ